MLFVFLDYNKYKVLDSGHGIRGITHSVLCCYKKVIHFRVVMTHATQRYHTPPQSGLFPCNSTARGVLYQTNYPALVAPNVFNAL